MTAGPATVAVVPPDVSRGIRATYIAFGTLGFTFASWSARIPQVRDQLRVDPAQLGFILLAIAAGSLVSLPLAGSIVGRFGSARTVSAAAVAMAGALITVSVGYLSGVPPVVAGLLVVGFALGAWDVAMNVEGAELERRLGRSIMPRFHAGYSLGTVAGALLGWAFVAVGVPVTAHLLGVAAVLVAAVPYATRGFVPNVSEQVAAAVIGDGGGRGRLTAWKEPRTLLIGVFVLCFAFVEGTGNDWIGLAVIDGHHTRAALGTLGFAIFLAAMTLGRWFGPGLLDRHGRIPTLRVLAAVGVAGVLLFVFGPTLPLVFAGAALWGVGVSLGFPVGMTAAADDPRHAATRVSVVASVGYWAFLGGPAVIGLLGSHYGVLRALAVAAAVLTLAAVVAPAVRPVRA